jgi:peptidylprolyl isomerase
MERSRAIALAVFGAVLAAVVVIVLVAGGDGGEASATADLEAKPEVTVPDEPATELVTEDVVVGEGAEAASGDEVEVEYVGVAQSTGEEFDSSWEREDPFSFELGAGNVIPGWDQGIVGMREGGRRLLVIPGELAYGETGQPPDIGPNETLVFAVDLVEVRQPGSGSGGG